MTFAIGTDLAHMAGKSLISTVRGIRFGNVNFRLGQLMLAGAIGGFRNQNPDALAAEALQQGGLV